MWHVCKRCKTAFNRNTSKARFCKHECYVAWKKENGVTTGQFKLGILPWNKGTKGVMKPNSGTFQKGRDSDTKQPIGATAYREDKSGKVRAWIKVSDGEGSYDWILRAVHVWRKYRGPVPNGKVVHHKDRNQLSDVIGNLELLTRAEHLKEHRSEHKRRHARFAQGSNS